MSNSQKASSSGKTGQGTLFQVQKYKIYIFLSPVICITYSPHSINDQLFSSKASPKLLNCVILCHISFCQGKNVTAKNMRGGSNFNSNVSCDHTKLLK